MMIIIMIIIRLRLLLLIRIIRVAARQVDATRGSRISDSHLISLPSWIVVKGLLRFPRESPVGRSGNELVVRMHTYNRGCGAPWSDSSCSAPGLRRTLSDDAVRRARPAWGPVERSRRIMSWSCGCIFSTTELKYMDRGRKNLQKLTAP